MIEEELDDGNYPDYEYEAYLKPEEYTDWAKFKSKLLIVDDGVVFEDRITAITNSKDVKSRVEKLAIKILEVDAQLDARANNSSGDKPHH